MMRMQATYALLTLAMAATACADAVSEPELAPGDPSFAVVAQSGTVVLPSGANVCSQMAGGTVYNIRFMKVVEGGADVAAGISPNITCPNNTWTFGAGLEEGATYVARITNDATGGNSSSIFPRISFDTFTVAGATTSQEIVMTPGVRLGGLVTLNDQPFPGVFMDVEPLITDVSGFNFSTFAYTKGDGRYGEDLLNGAERSFALLQPGVTYEGFCGAVAGARLASSSASPFVAGTQGFTCRFRDGLSRNWTHEATDLVMTAGPGNFDVHRAGSDGSFGFGVQYPVVDEPARALSDNRQHMFNAGWMVSVNDEVVLTSTDADGWLVCGDACHDILPVTTRPAVGADLSGVPGAKRVTWRLSDSLSVESRGVRINQQSWDGNGGDYVLYRVALQNRGSAFQAFRFGFAADWDIASEFSNQSTGVSGNIAYATMAGAPYMGSVFLGDYPTRSYYGHANNGQGEITHDTQIGVLNGSVSNAGVSSTDIWYIQSVGTFYLQPNQQRIIWFAIVAGETMAELEANAAAAHADMIDRTTP